MITLDQLIRGPRKADDATLERPLDHLFACHRRIEDRLQVLERAAGHMEFQPPEALDAVAGCIRFFDSNGAWHTADEEESLFPRLLARLRPEELAYVEGLEQEHRAADLLYVELKKLAGELEASSQMNAGTDLIQRFSLVVARLSKLYRAHIASEDQVLISLGRRVLAGAELREISKEMKARRGLDR